MRKIIVGILMLGFFVFLGAFFRFGWLMTHQQAGFERKILYKDLADSKLGGKTPQETWNLYLDALEKEDTDLAVQYWMPEERDNMKKVLSEFKKAGVLNRYVANRGKILKQATSTIKELRENEKVFVYDFIREKDLDFIRIHDARTEEYMKLYWQDEKIDVIKTQTEIVFQLNKYSNKWLIK